MKPGFPRYRDRTYWSPMRDSAKGRIIRVVPRILFVPEVVLIYLRDFYFAPSISFKPKIERGERL